MPSIFRFFIAAMLLACCLGPIEAEEIFTSPLETIWEEGGFTEGAAVGPKGDIYFSDFAQPFDARPARIMRYRLAEKKVTVHCADSKMANGLMFDREGKLYACCASPLGGGRALVVITPAGEVKPVAERFRGKRFNSPNDIVIDRQGRIYFSDPKYVGPEEMELESMDVYRFDPDGAIHRVTTEIDKPNGLMLSPNGKTMYIAETDNGTDKADIVSDAKQGRMTLNAFDVDAKGNLSNKQVIVDFGDQVGIDGMTVDSQGRIYAAVRSAERFGISCFSPEGEELAHLKTPELPTNCCFGRGGDNGTLYITAGNGFYRVKTSATGHHTALAIQAVADQRLIARLLKRQLVDPSIPQQEVEDFCHVRVPDMPEIESVEQWTTQSERLRRRVLKEVVFRGEAAAWRDHPLRVEWEAGELSSGEGYSIRKLRYEALPGFWIPALLYVPSKIEGRVPAMLNVNGHDRAAGKAAKYKQMRCINQAKRGIIALNVEWIGMGQLNRPGNQHYRMNQLDLCGVSGLAPFYLAMRRGLDLLLAMNQVDPERLGVAGLSGGGWQTIMISALDTRVKLCNPVAGYSSFRTRIENHSDLGDSEQTPCDLATIVDYTHLTAMVAPRAALLTFNVKDNCCFASPHALPPLLESARPAYAIHGAAKQLDHHVNETPGTHNFERDNREALYRALGKHFYADERGFKVKEINAEKELLTSEQLHVSLPVENATFQSLAMKLSESLPNPVKPPADRMAAEAWQTAKRNQLRRLVHFRNLRCDGRLIDVRIEGQLTVAFWRLELRKPGATASQAPIWSVPATELLPNNATDAVLVVGDQGRAALAEEVSAHLKAKKRVLAVDPFYFGESKIRSRDFLFALLVSAVGERPIGIQSGQLASISKWLYSRNEERPVGLAAYGPRTGVMALIASALAPQSIGRLEVERSLGSLREVIEREWDSRKTPELMCFGLLKHFDVAQLAALSAPRPVRFVQPSERLTAELKKVAAVLKVYDPSEFAQPK